MICGRLLRSPKLINDHNGLLTCRLLIEVPRRYPGESPVDVFEIWVENGIKANECSKHLGMGAYIRIYGSMYIPQAHEQPMLEHLDPAIRIVAREVQRVLAPPMLSENTEGYIPV